jgi:archaellum component FlaC
LATVDESLRTLANTVDNNYRQIQGQIQGINTELLSIKNDITGITSQLSTISADILIALQQSDLALSTAARVSVDVVLLTNRVSSLETSLISIQLTINAINITVGNMQNQIDSLNNQIIGLNSTVSTLNASVVSLSSRVTSLEANAARQQFIRQGNEYMLTRRVGGNPGSTYFYRVTYLGGTNIINANVGYTATIFDSQTGTSNTQTIYLAAPFDVFTITGRYNYPMIQGPCVYSFTGNSTSPNSGYITTL